MDTKTAVRLLVNYNCNPIDTIRAIRQWYLMELLPDPGYIIAREWYRLALESIEQGHGL